MNPSKPQRRELPEKMQERLAQLRAKNVSPNKPIMFAVIHEPENVERAMEKFLETIRGKNFLYIELMPHAVNEILAEGKYSETPKVKAYQELCLRAHVAGLKVVPLDSEKYMRDELRTVGNRDMPFNQYKNKYKREKLWVGTLQGVKSDSVIVMHPNHAVVVSAQLQLPPNNIIMQDKFHSSIYDLEVRQYSKYKTEEIEAARLKRRNAKALARKYPPRRV